MEDLLTVCKEGIAPYEGNKLRLYQDEFGNWTIGRGHNLTANGISEAVSDLMYSEDINEAIRECKSKIGFFDKLDTARQYVLVNMCFNMGIGALLAFHNMLSHMQCGDFNAAATDLSKSLEYKEVPNRVFPLIKIMETGTIAN